MRVQIHIRNDPLEQRLPLDGFRKCSIEGGDNGVESTLCLFGDPFELPYGGPEGTFNIISIGSAAEIGGRCAHRFHQFFAVHQHQAALCEFRFFSGSRFKRIQFLDSMEEKLLVTADRRQLGFSERTGLNGPAPFTPCGGNVFYQRHTPSERIEKFAVGGGIQQSLAFELAVDLNQRFSDPPKHADADRLVVNECAGSTVLVQYPTQDQSIFRYRDRMFLQEVNGRVIASNFKTRGYNCLGGAVSDETRLGAGAQRKSERIQKDRLTGARLAGQRA
jgi:hypothetical protein